MNQNSVNRSQETLAIFLTGFVVTCGPVLMLNFGYSIGILGFTGILGVLILSALVAIPAVMALSELVSNEHFEGRGNEYFLISGSYGRTIGMIISLILYLTYVFAIAFFIRFFNESLSPLLNLIGWNSAVLRKILSMLTVFGFVYLTTKKIQRPGTIITTLVSMLIIIVCFLIFKAPPLEQYNVDRELFSFRTGDIAQSFFDVFVLIWPVMLGAITCFSLTRRLKTPGKSLPAASLSLIIVSIFIFILLASKISISISPALLTSNRFILGTFLVNVSWLIPIVLALSSATAVLTLIPASHLLLRSMGNDKILPFEWVNKLVASGKSGGSNKSKSLQVTTLLIIIFLLQANLDSISKSTSFVLVLLFSLLNTLSFLYQFAVEPTYRPSFKSRWYFSLIGLLAGWTILFFIDSGFAAGVLVVIIFLYLRTRKKIKGQNDLLRIATGGILQLQQKISVFLQRIQLKPNALASRPSIIALSTLTFEQGKGVQLLNWLASFAVPSNYVHVEIDNSSNLESVSIENNLSRLSKITDRSNRVLLHQINDHDMLSALRQLLSFQQLLAFPANLIVLEFNKSTGSGLSQLSACLSVLQKNKLDFIVMGVANKRASTVKEVKVWLDTDDAASSNLAILLSRSIADHRQWKGAVTEYLVIEEKYNDEVAEALTNNKTGFEKFAISPNRINTHIQSKVFDWKTMIMQLSKKTALTIVALNSEKIGANNEVFQNWDELGDVLFVNAAQVTDFN